MVDFSMAFLVKGEVIFVLWKRARQRISLADYRCSVINFFSFDAASLLAAKFRLLLPGNLRYVFWFPKLTARRNATC